MEIHICVAPGERMAIEPIVDRMVQATNRHLVWDAVRGFFAEHGFDRIIYADMRDRSPQILNSYPDSFGDYYADVCNPQDDPFFRYCCASLEPRQTGAEYLDHYDYLTRSERQVILAAREAGMRSGFSCTFHVADKRGMGGWNIGSTLGRSEVEKIQAEHGTMLRLTALYAHERMDQLRLSHFEGDRPVLSPRERDCLIHLAAGLRTQQIADRLDIKPVTVELHVRRARMKLKAATREQALAKAISMRLLDL